MILEKLQQKIDDLSMFPFRGSPIDTGDTYAKYRSIMVEHYHLIYTINEEDKVVYVVEIMHEKQDWRKILRSK